MKVKVMFMFVLFIVFSANAIAQKAKYIDLKKTSATVWEESTKAGATKVFTFNAVKGQLLSIDVTDDTNEASIDLGKVSLEPNTRFEYKVEVTKQYRLSVTNNSSKTTSFRISLALSKPAKKT